MSYMLKILELEEEIEGMKIDDSMITRYTNINKRERELNKFANKISHMGLRQSDEYDFLKRIEEYKRNINLYKNAISKRQKKDGLRTKFIIALAGAICFGLGLKFDDIRKLYKKRRKDGEKQNAEKLADYVLQRLLDEEIFRRLFENKKLESGN